MGVGGQINKPPGMEADAVKLDAYYLHSGGINFSYAAFSDSTSRGISQRGSIFS